MRAKRFVEAVKQLNFADVLDDGALRRVNALYVEAIEHSANHVLVGFRVRGPVVRIVWAVDRLLRYGLSARAPERRRRSSARTPAFSMLRPAWVVASARLPWAFLFASRWRCDITQ